MFGRIRIVYVARKLQMFDNSAEYQTTQLTHTT